MNENSDTICDLLWAWPIINLARNEVKMCCRTKKVFSISEDQLSTNDTNVFTNLPEFKKEREKLLAGVKTENCKYCWDLEEKNIKSPRRGSYYDILNISENSESNDILRSEHPTQLELIIGNACDMQCIYCGPQSSSKWAEYHFKKNKISDDQRRYLQQIVKNSSINFNQAFWKWFDQSAMYSLKKIKIVGGEPAFNPEFYKLMDNLSERYKKSEKSVRIVVTTNLNTTDIERFISCFDNEHKNINYNINVSIETIQRRAEFIRIGLDWQRFSDNLVKLLELANIRENVNVSILSSVNSLSVSSLRELLSWLHGLGNSSKISFDIQENIVNSEIWLRPSILDKSYAKYIDSAIEYCIENKCFLSYLPFLRTIKQAIEKNEIIDHCNKKSFKEGIETMCEINKLSFLDIFPEMRSMIE